MKTNNVFEVDAKGLARQLARRGKEFVALELIQNALDERVREVAVTLEKIEGRRGLYELCVVDDAPDGFADLSHAFTLFADSSKKDQPQKRGFMNVGEKLVIALCEEAEVVSTKGRVRFDLRKGSRTVAGRPRTESGTVFRGTLRMTREEHEATLGAVRRVLCPKGVRLTLNGEDIESRSALAVTRHALPTRVADANGYMRQTKRQCEVRFVTTLGEETPTLYEMGIPVVEIDCAWHVDVGQKVLLNSDRDNVTPTYLREVQMLALNSMHKRMSPDQARETWVVDAMANDAVHNHAVVSVLDHRYGKQRVIADPSDPEGTKLAVSQGYTVVQPGSFTGDVWRNIKRAGAALPAGRVTPSPKPFHAGGKALRIMHPEDYGEAVRDRVRFVEMLGRFVLGRCVCVQVANDAGWGFDAAYGDAELTLNYRRLGRSWFEHPHRHEDVLRLLIHEFAHDFPGCGDHLSAAYHKALCVVGARVAQAALNTPRLFDGLFST